MTATPGSGARMATDRPPYLQRFSRSERALHWVHASAFFVLLGTGLILYLPRLSELVGRRLLLKDVHFYTGVGWAAAILAVVALGDRRGLQRTLRELEWFDGDDRRWLRGRPVPQGRFNAGQKLNAAITAAFAVLFFVTGLLLWYGERDTRFRLPGTIVVHDALTYASFVVVAGHLYLSLVHRSTRHALRGMVLGTVREDWARDHHAKWAKVVGRSWSDGGDPLHDLSGEVRARRARAGRPAG